MSNVKYIEIDSTYRNRNEWPNPGEFEVLISQTGRKDLQNADDPVSLSAPIGLSWSCGTFNIIPTLPLGALYGRVLEIGLKNAGDQKTTIKVIPEPGSSFQRIENYYNGVVLKNETQSIASRITSYVWMGINRDLVDVFQITVEGTLKIDDNDIISIKDPTAYYDPNPTDPPIPDMYSYFFVPNGRVGFNAYQGYILYNDKGSYADILSYDTNTKLVKVNVTGKDWRIGADILSIRKEPPIRIDLIDNIEFSSSVFSLPSTFSDQLNVYKNSYIKIYDDIRRVVRYETFTGKAIGGSTTTVIFPENASDVNGFYNNAYIKIEVPVINVRRIISYSVTGVFPNLIRTATVDLPFDFSVFAGVDFTFRSVFVSPEFGYPINSPFELLLFSQDNHNPFTYTGNQDNTSFYQIELLDVILPNKILNCGFGSRIAFYPYLYVQISNISSNGNKNIIYSNNSNANNMVFRVPIYDVQNPISSAFVKLDGDGMFQTLNFKPNESIFFSVLLPNGDIFKVVEEEKYSPYSPNPDIQISALFSFKKVLKEFT
jgi:hypothetical protein